LVLPHGRLPGKSEAQALIRVHPRSTQFTSRGVPLCSPTLRVARPATPGTIKCPESLRTFKVLPLTSWPRAPRRRAVPTFLATPQAHAPVLNPLAASVSPLHRGSLPVAVSWEKDLPVVSSASLSLRAWTPTPAALVVHLPVPSTRQRPSRHWDPVGASLQPLRQLQHGLYFGVAVIH
jgi:hypothetical protein